MKKAYSLLEITIVIFVISILATFVIGKLNSSFDFSNDIKIKSEIALIRNGISQKVSSNILLNKDSNFTLDSVVSNTKDSKLFENILDKPLLSTTNEIKKTASWIKEEADIYKIYIDKNQFLVYEYKNKSFICKSSLELCGKYE